MKLVLKQPCVDRGCSRADLVGRSKLCQCSQQCIFVLIVCYWC